MDLKFILHRTITVSEAKYPEAEDHQKMKETKLQMLFKGFNHA